MNENLAAKTIVIGTPVSDLRGYLREVIDSARENFPEKDWAVIHFDALDELEAQVRRDAMEEAARVAESFAAPTAYVGMIARHIRAAAERAR